jgi:uncharacterized protein
MIALLSPAKSLDFEKPIPPVDSTEPRLAADAGTLAAAAARLSAPKLARLMHISDPLARLNVQRFRGFAEAPERPAIFAFAGDVYQGLAVRSLGPGALAFAADHLRILSGLYGLLRPLDRIRPYRLEMGTRWAPGRAADLYGYWRDRVAALLARDLEAEGSGTIVNLASREYFQAVAPFPPAGARVITVDFRDRRADGTLRFNSFDAKRARGLMARWICERQLRDPAALGEFDLAGYRFEGEAEGGTLAFVRLRA